jgi:putative nucleotidyltransferase with HDIG domain
VDLGANGADLVRWSKAVAHELLAGVGTRLAHVEAVALRAEEVGRLVLRADRGLLVAAAYLHDVGYAPALRETGLHSLDGARWLRTQGVDRHVCNLVAHHSGARFEAEQRGLLAELEEFALEPGPVMDCLTFADMTTGSDGRYVRFEERLADILRRYSPDDPVHRAIVRARPVLRRSVDRTAQRLAGAAHPMYGAGRASR